MHKQLYIIAWASGSFEQLANTVDERATGIFRCAGNLVVVELTFWIEQNQIGKCATGVDSNTCVHERGDINQSGARGKVCRQRKLC